MSDRPEMEPFQRIRERLQEKAEELGLYIHGFAIMPNPEGPDFVQAVFIIGDKALENAEMSEEDLEIKNQFDAIIAADEQTKDVNPALQQKADAAAEDLRKFLDGE